MACIIRSLLVLLLSGVWGTANAALIQSSDILAVEGRDWAQPDLFIDLSWADINGVCPGGVCGTGSLNGYDMSGWIWAGVNSLNQLFNHYIGSNVMGPGPDLYSISGTEEPVRNGFFGAGGWRPTDIVDFSLLFHPAAQIFGRMADSDDYLARVNHVAGASFFTGVIISNTFSTNVPNDDSYLHHPVTNELFNVGAFFYRADTAQVPLPSSAWLLAAAILAWRAGVRRARA